MKLTYKHVPVEFLAALPEGIKYVQKEGMDFLVIEQLYCREGHSLMAEHVRLHGEPSICLDARIGSQRGRIFVDAYWGSHDKLYGFIPREADLTSITEAHCPHCGISLLTERHCSYNGCGSGEAILLNLPGGINTILVCARHGCPDHELHIKRMPEAITSKLRKINYFSESYDDMFQGI
jgi:hypothetical protein